MEFSFEKIEEDLFKVTKAYTINKNGHGSDITGPYWMLIKTEVKAGRIWWVSNNKEVTPAKKHYIFVPPYSWTMEHYEKGTTIKFSGLISRSLPATPSFPGPILFNSEKPLPKSLQEVSQMLHAVSSFEYIGLRSHPSSLSERAKTMIDKGFDRSIEINEIAKNLKTSPAALSRKFKSDFGETPAFYRKGLKVTVGMYELMMGTPPIEAAALAGYQDLGRFYKQFKAYLKQTPAEYLSKSKNAKTLKSK